MVSLWRKISLRAILATFLVGKLPTGKTPIRLLSCSSLADAQKLADDLDRPVIATAGKVDVHESGNIGSSTEKWFLLEKNKTPQELQAGNPLKPNPPTPDDVNKGRFVRMGNEFDEAKYLEAIANTPSISRKSTRIQTKEEGCYNLMTENGLQVKDGLILDNSGNLYSSPIMATTGNNQRLDFIIRENGELCLGKGHYFMANNQDEFLKGAGGVRVKDGKITYIDENSGHYAPNRQELDNQVNLLKILGVTDTGLKVEIKIPTNRK